MSMKQQINDAMKAAMRAKDKPRLGAIRLIQADIKRIEVDERIEVDDARVLAILDKMVKQRRDSITQYEDAGRQELADIEIAEITVIQDFLPTALSDDEIAAMVAAAVAETGAASMADMGKVMGILKPQIQGRAD
ncbi:MAG: GatB/YqeY domain-containing protein, partial [Pseudomonadales bacterium]